MQPGSTSRGRLFLDTDLGLGIVHTLDMGLAADAVERGQWAPGIAFAELPRRYGYDAQPGRAAGPRRHEKAGPRAGSFEPSRLQLFQGGAAAARRLRLGEAGAALLAGRPAARPISTGR